MTSVNINIIVSGLAGLAIAPEPWLATLPISGGFIASMLTTMPASLLMGKYGRKPIFMAGAVMLFLGMMVQMQMLLAGNFTGYMAGALLIGGAHGIAQFYRYAAADALPEKENPLLSHWCWQGLIAAFAGATIVKMSLGWFGGSISASCFLAAGVLQLPTLLLLAGLKIPPVEKTAQVKRSLSRFLHALSFRADCGSGGYAVMSFLMTAAPLQIVSVSKLSDAANATVIQWHVFAMFIPSFFTGFLIRRVGEFGMIASGLLLYVVAVIVLLQGFLLALFLRPDACRVWLECPVCDRVGNRCIGGLTGRTRQGSGVQRFHGHHGDFRISVIGRGAALPDRLAPDGMGGVGACHDHRH